MSLILILITPLLNLFLPATLISLFVIIAAFRDAHFVWKLFHGG